MGNCPEGLHDKNPDLTVCPERQNNYLFASGILKIMRKNTTNLIRNCSPKWLDYIIRKKNSIILS